MFSSLRAANPFELPSDEEIFRLREDEKREKAEARDAMKARTACSPPPPPPRAAPLGRPPTPRPRPPAAQLLGVAEKTTFTQRVGAMKPVDAYAVRLPALHALPAPAGRPAPPEPIAPEPAAAARGWPGVGFSHSVGDGGAPCGAERRAAAARERGHDGVHRQEARDFSGPGAPRTAADCGGLGRTGPWADGPADWARAASGLGGDAPPVAAGSRGSTERSRKPGRGAATTRAAADGAGHKAHGDPQAGGEVRPLRPRSVRRPTRPPRQPRRGAAAAAAQKPGCANPPQGAAAGGGDQAQRGDAGVGRAALRRLPQRKRREGAGGAAASRRGSQVQGGEGAAPGRGPPGSRPRAAGRR